MAAAKNDFKFEIINELGVISENSKGWCKELNRISWNGAEPKYDIRDWAPNHETMGKGITLTLYLKIKHRELMAHMHRMPIILI